MTHCGTDQKPCGDRLGSKCPCGDQYRAEQNNPTAATERPAE